MVGDGCGLGVYGIFVAVGVSVGMEAATVGGTIIPANSRVVAANPMKRPIPRYLISVRMDWFFFVV